MATKTAKGKHTVHDVTITAKGTFNPDPLENVKSGDQIQITIPPKKLVTIKVTITVARLKGGGGGPIIITS
jgi:hypothetical protein